MFTRLNNAKLAITVEAFTTNYTNLQVYRWGKKPRWLPTAKTKMFRVAPRPQIPTEDYEELKRLHNNYRTQIKSLTGYFTEKYSTENIQQFDIEQHEKSIKDDFLKCTAINDEWNRQIKIQREERVAKELEESVNLAKQRLEERQQRQLLKLQAADVEVRRVIEDSKDFITPDKLDAAIEYALNNPVDYNFALDLDGNVYKGRNNDSVKFEIKQ
ncbi:hypothetical protein PPYR_01823 [Photinus pyralis]|uniref:Small ribosomal subunit protein mS26 n=1 Tax=Photinus pyralis TaxID=7054 RepID=A0A5N4B5M9_PHOPY|nr:probable 28S ribosomal protein S26, mitochondrial [Photinus pyralis]KAB0804853.1 hypothetical protein PPYR_01823 [Photinus pyralis]